MPVKGMTQAEIDEATRAQVAAGAKSTDRVNRLPGETASEANARITAGYREMTAKPILSQEQKDAGMTVQFVRTASGGAGEYVPIKPIGYDGPTEITQFTPGVIPANSQYTTGTSVGFNPDDYKTAEDMQRIAAKAASGQPLTADEKAFMAKGVVSTTSTTSTASTGKTAAQLEAERLQKIADESAKKAAEAAAAAADTQAKLKRLQDIQAKLARGEKLTEEEYKLIGYTPPASTDTPAGTAWVKGADGKWTKPPMPTDGKTYTWDDNKGWVASTTVDGSTPVRPVGTPPAFIYDPNTKNWVMPPKPTTKGNWLFDPISGWVDSTLVPGAGGTSTTDTRTLAVNTFKNTLAIFFGPAEVSKPWVDELYKLVNPYYKSGSSVDEALNLAIQEGRNNPNLKEFTSRFSGIYALQDKLNQGIAVTVPTIAEYFASEAKMGDVLNQAGLSSLNQQSYLGDIIGKGVNVTEFTNRINNVFLRIDQLPQQAKDFIAGSFPTLDKTQLAKAILGGEKGAIQLSKELGGLEVQAAFKAQGLGVDTATGLDIASRGFGYQETLTGAGTVAQNLPTYEKLQEITTGKDVKTEQAQKELQGVVFNKSIVDSMRAEQLANQEVARFRGSSGLAGSKSLASQQRGAGLI